MHRRRVRYDERMNGATPRPVSYMDRTRRFYAAQGFDKPYQWARNDGAPFAALKRPLAESTLGLVTTAALYDRKESDPRAVASGNVAEPPPRLFANDLAWDKQATHMEDLNAYCPLDRLQELVAEGRLGSLASRFHCVPTEYSQRRTIDADAPEILRRCRQDGVDAVLLVPL